MKSAGPLARALLGSALIHVLLLVGLADLPGRASLARPERLAVVVSAPRPADGPPAHAAGAPRGGRPVAATEAVSAPPVSHAVEPVATDRGPFPPRLPPASGGVPQPLAGQAASENRPGPTLAAPAPDTGKAEDRQAAGNASTVADSEELRALRIALAAGAGAHREYPPMARERGWQGVVGVTVHYIPGREVPEVTVSKSSGVPSLDQAALRMMRRAAEAVAVPGSLRGRAARIEMPIDYRLED